MSFKYATQSLCALKSISPNKICWLNKLFFVPLFSFRLPKVVLSLKNKMYKRLLIKYVIYILWKYCTSMCAVSIHPVYESMYLCVCVCMHYYIFYIYKVYECMIYYKFILCVYHSENIVIKHLLWQFRLK